MESAVLGVVLDSSVLIAAERAKLPTPEVIKSVRSPIGDVEIVITLADLMIGACALELGYSVCTSNVRDFRRIPGLHIVNL